MNNPLCKLKNIIYRTTLNINTACGTSAAGGVLYKPTPNFLGEIIEIIEIAYRPEPKHIP
ncbi:MAG: hypothetical protein MJ001_08125 [Paludibacteraceae bacterium]|nr:hypothetical protein [Paludibacteraceae bacterium]